MPPYGIFFAVALLLLAIAVIWGATVWIRKGHCVWRRVVKIAVLSVPVVMVAGVAASAVWNTATSAWYFATVTPPGSIVKVDGSPFYITCSGRGSPTVVLEAGLGSDHLDWQTVQARLAPTTSVCSYDRAGYGWSRVRTGPRDADAIARDLHGLLNAAGVKGPVVLVGHSMGGLYARVYAGRYRRDMAGLVLVDASTPLQEERLDPEIVGFVTEQVELLKWANLSGVSRIAGICAATSADPAVRRMEIEHACRPEAGIVMQREMEASRASGLEAIRGGRFGDLPLLVISHDPSRPILPPQFGVTRVKKFEVIWNGMQNDIAALSSDSRRIIAYGSGHNIPTEEPDIVAHNVALFVQKVRTGRSRH